MWPAHQIKFASHKGNQIATGKVEEKVTLLEQSDDWVPQSDVAYNEDGQRQNGPFTAQIATTGKRSDGIVFSDKLKLLMRGTHLSVARDLAFTPTSAAS